ncbi:MAG: type II toxin-antitoxin system PemK/MazF family toxin [Desulfuromonadales bacterium]|nr:type II toxin-antitoxin system PemK/MazF family toxin [Desulfuromonadales bacterium]
MTFEAFDVVVVPFPFTDNATTKRRPALILSDAKAFNQQAGQAVMAMITSARNSDWPLDIEIQDLDAAGLPASSIIRMKLFTLDEHLIIRKAGRLARPDQSRAAEALQQLFPLLREHNSRNCG